MNCLDRFNRKMAIDGGSLRGEKIRSAKLLLRETFSDDPSFHSDIYVWEHGVESYDGKTPLPIRLYSRAFSNANGVTVKFQTLIENPIVAGDIVYDLSEDEYLICVESFNIDGIHWSGKLNLCNWILKWQDDDGNILEYPCNDINSTQYNSGEQSNQKFTIGSSQHMITLPYDENTIVLKSPRRFFLDRDIENPTSFMITQNDNTSYSYGKKGLVKITLVECEGNNDTDRPDLGICDYVYKEDLKTDNDDRKPASKSVIFYDTTVIKSGGNSQVFVGRFFDDVANEISGVDARWNVVCDFVDALDIDIKGNEISIGIDDDRFVDEEFKIVLTDENGDFSSSLLVKVGSLL